MVKVISLSEEAYKKLKSLKGRKSFSETIIEIVDERKKNDIMDFAGAFSENSTYWMNFKKEIRKSRDKSRLREVKL